MSAPVSAPGPAPETAPVPPAADDRSRRRRLLGLLAVLALLAAAVAYGARGDAAPAPAVGSGPSAEQLEQLRVDADLEPCPAGLGPQLPDLVLPCLGGGPDVDLTAAAPGRPTLVNVWASWCAPCVREVPLLAEVEARAGDRVALVGVLTQDSLDSALAFAQDRGMRWPSLVDVDGAVMRTWSSGPPVTLFLTAEGEVAHVERGEFTSVDEVAGLLAEHLGVQL